MMALVTSPGPWLRLDTQEITGITHEFHLPFFRCLEGGAFAAEARELVMGVEILSALRWEADSFVILSDSSSSLAPASLTIVHHIHFFVTSRTNDAALAIARVVSGLLAPGAKLRRPYGRCATCKPYYGGITVASAGY